MSRTVAGARSGQRTRAKKYNRRESLAGYLFIGPWIAGLLIWAIGHALSVWAARRDPQFVDVARRHLRYPSWMQP